MSELTPLRDAVEALVDRSRPVDFAELQARATARGRRRVAVAALGALAVVALSAFLVPGLGADTRDVPAAPPSSLNGEAARVIAAGDLAAHGADDTGAVLTVWSTCSGSEPGCASAWRLDRGSRVLTGLLNPSLGHPVVRAVDGGFVLHRQGHQEGEFVSADGSARSLTQQCPDRSWPRTREPGRFALVEGLVGPNLVDVSKGTSCDTTGYQEARTLSSGVYADDGTLWGLAAGEVRGMTVARYDGDRWTYRDLAGDWVPQDSALTADGSTVVVLETSNEERALEITTDGGETWSQVTDLPFAGFDSFALTDPSTLLVADAAGHLWRSTDLQHFEEVELGIATSQVVRADDAIIARAGSTDGLLRISADGRVEELDPRS